MADILTDKPEIEYIDGQPYPKVSPKRTHAVVQLAIAMLLRRCAGERGTVATEWRFKLAPGTELVPDVAYVSYDRLRPLSDEDSEEPPFAPDVAVEVRSPSLRHTLATKKIAQYLSHGCELVLDVDPYERVVYAHAPDRDAMCYRVGDRMESASLAWLQFDVADLFRDVDIRR